MVAGFTVSAVCLAGIAAAAGQGVDLQFAEQVIAEGRSRAALARAYDRLCSAPLDDPEFVLSDVHFHLKRRFTEYSGDISGRMLGALQAAGPRLGREAGMIETLVEAFKQYQKADGHFGADQNLQEGADQQRDMPILWGNGRLLLALAERCRTHPDPELLAVATRIGDYVISTRPYYGRKENFSSVGGNYSSGYTTCYPSLIDGLVALGEVTGQSRFYDEARFIARLSLLDSEFKDHHSHGRLTAYRGMLDLDRLSGQTEFLDVVRAGCRKIADDLMLPTTGVTERFNREGSRDEGCTEADWIRVNVLLWRATGDTAYLDLAESVARNHLLATQFGDGGFGHRYWRPLLDDDRSYPGGRFSHVGAEAYWCCSMHGTQILADLANWGVLVSDGEILVTWLAEVRSTVVVDGRRVTVTTRREKPGFWRILLETSEPLELGLRLRIPGWAKTIAVDGQEVSSQNGWARVERKCAGSLLMSVTIPNDIRLAGAYTSQPLPDEPVRVYAGPDLFCLPDVFVSTDLPGSDVVPTLVLAADSPANGEIPVVVRDPHFGQETRSRLVPMIDRAPGGVRFLFHVTRVDAETFARRAAQAAEPPNVGPSAELAFGCEGDFIAFFNGQKVYQRSGGWGEPARIQVPAQAGANVVAVKVGSKAAKPGFIGRISVGERLCSTSNGGWTAIRCPGKLDAAWLTDVREGAEDALKLRDLGGLGTEPWGHIPAVFAGTDARWIWPEEQPSQQVEWYLLRCAFDCSAAK